MTRDQVLMDLYGRLTSRKLWLCLVSIGLAAYGHFSGNLTYLQFQTAILAAVGVYTVSEGLTDAAGALTARKSSPDTVVTTNVDSSAPSVVPLLDATARPKRTRPSRAKSLAKEARP